MDTSGFSRRKAPYAPISALREFFERMRNSSVPQKIDKKYLERFNIAPGNEWALLSALKFLGVIDDRGAPAAAYIPLLTSDRFESTLASLVKEAYADLIQNGGLTMSGDDLANYFRVASSASQARNAARFFREVSQLAGLAPDTHQSQTVLTQTSPVVRERSTRGAALSTAETLEAPATPRSLKAEILSRLPPPNPAWSAADYIEVYDRILRLLEHADGLD